MNPESPKTLQESATKHLKTADHILNITFPLLQDPKLLLTVADNLFLSMKYSMDAMINYNYYKKRQMNIPTNFEDRLNIFRFVIVKRYRFNNDLCVKIHELKEIITNHKKSPVEFRWKNSYIICNNSYDCCKVSLDLLKKYLKNAKEFIHKIHLIIKDNE